MPSFTQFFIARRVHLLRRSLCAVVSFVFLPLLAQAEVTAKTVATTLSERSGIPFKVVLSGNNSRIWKALAVGQSSAQHRSAQEDPGAAAFTVQQLLEQNGDLFSVDTNQLQISRAITRELMGTPGETLTFINFTQKFQSYTVLGGEVKGMFRNGHLRTIESNFYPNINIPSFSPINLTQAVDAAKTYEMQGLYAGQLPAESLEPSPAGSEFTLMGYELVVYPVEISDGTYYYTLAWQLDFGPLNSNFSSPTYFIDAAGGGFLNRINRAKFDSTSGTITGTIYPEDNRTGATNNVQLGGIKIGAVGMTWLFLSDTTTNAGFYYLDNVQSLSPPFFLYANFSQNFFPITQFTSPYESNYHNPPPITPLPAPATVSKIFEDPASAGTGHDFNFDVTQDFHIREAVNVNYQLGKVYSFFVRPWSRSWNWFDTPPLGETLDLSVVIDAAHPSWICRSNLLTEQLVPGGPDFRYVMFYGGELDYNGQKICESSAFNSDATFHEYGHLVSFYAMNKDRLAVNGTNQRRAMDEGQADYWAATINDEPSIMENLTVALQGVGGLQTTDWGPWRNLHNTKNGGYDGSHNEYWNGEIIGGAMWDLRQAMKLRYGLGNGLPPDDPFFEPGGNDKADELFIAALHTRPSTFNEFLTGVLSVNDNDFDPNTGTPDIDIICKAFQTNHGINPAPFYDCSIPYSGGDPNSGGTGYNFPVGPADVFFPVHGSVIDDSSLAGIMHGNATIEGFTDFDLKRSGFASGQWSSAGISLANGGMSEVNDAQLGTLTPSQLRNGCFYELKLSVNSSVFGQRNDSAIFKKAAGTVPGMPRMACVYRTANEGGENDACEVIALASDPKPAWFELSASDWRRGRDARLVPGPSSQFRGAGANDVVNVMCDPDNNGGDCSRDCWNITGTNGNRSGGNDGLDDVFCKASSGCSPVSFSGCPADDLNCINSAATGLESVYNKIVYLHWSNIYHVDTFLGLFGDERSAFVDCSDDNGRQYYSIINSDNIHWRLPQCSVPRCASPRANDAYDKFENLWGPSVLNPVLYARAIPRATVAPVLNCAGCGCPSDKPYCNAPQDRCEAKCPDGTPFGQCVRPAGSNQVMYCDNGTLVYGCNRAECASLSCSAGLYCSSSSGQCVRCLTDSHCNDGKFCTQDICLFGSCQHPLIPSDCNLLPSGTCGASPTGCFQCSCPCDRTCASVPGMGMQCVPSAFCDVRKCKACLKMSMSERISSLLD